MGKTKRTDLTLYRRLFQQARPYWPHIGAIFLVSLLAPPPALLAPLPLKIAVDSVNGTHPLPNFLYVFLRKAVDESPTGIFLVVTILVVALNCLTVA